MSCFQKKKLSETDNIEIATLKLQIERYLKKIASLETDKAKLSESLTELSDKVKNLKRVNSDQELLSSTELVTDLLNENAKVEIFLQALTQQATANQAGTSDAKAGNEMANQRFAISEKLADHNTLLETLKSTNDDKLDLATELESVRSELSEQLENVDQLKMELDVMTIHSKELRNEIFSKNTALKVQETSLNCSIDENNQLKLQLGRKDMEIHKLKWEALERETELMKCKSELEGQRALNSDVKTEFETAKENVQKTEANLEKVERELEERQLEVQTLKKENEELAMKLKNLGNPPDF